jgi:lipopolysaccharide transport system ATP-binding protein
MLKADEKSAILLDKVSKIYTTYEKPWHKLAEMVTRDRMKYAHEVHALQDVSLHLAKGDRLGIVGENGSGKSTLLKIITGVLTPSSGMVQVNGRVSALLELGAGFNGDLTGKENIQQFCMIHGLSPEETAEATPQIVSFSELGEFISYPVRTYSSGMAVRLGFACAVYVQPDILIVDEALSVGDSYFQNKCLHKIRSMLDKGATFIYVTHTADSVRALCNKGIWLEKGNLKLAGSSSEVGEKYASAMFARMAKSEFEEAEANSDRDRSPGNLANANPMKSDDTRRRLFRDRVEALRTGSGEMRITDISLSTNSDSVEVDAEIRIRVFFETSRQPPKDCALAIGITDSHGRQILHMSSAVKNVFVDFGPVGREYCLEFTFKNILCPGEYGISGGIAPLESHPQTNSLSVPKQVIDYCVGGARFSVRFPSDNTPRDLWGVVHTGYSVELLNRVENNE